MVEHVSKTAVAGRINAGRGATRSAPSPAPGFWKNLGLASSGAMLEYYDFVVYVYVAATIGNAFFPPGSSPTLRVIQTFAIYSIGFVARPVAGLLIANFADRYGRKRWFILTVIAMSASAVAIGALPTYSAIGWYAPALLLLLRVIQGCAVGGEMPSAAVFVSEHGRAGRLGVAGAIFQSMSYGGFLLGVLAAMAANAVAGQFPDHPSLSWRLPFLVGGALGLFSGYLRKHLDETPEFIEAEDRGSSHTLPLRTVLRSYYGPCLIGFGLLFVLATTNVVYFQYWPTFLETQLHMSHGRALSISLTAIVSIIIAMPIWGIVYDRYGWAAPMRVGAIAAGLSSCLLLGVLETAPADSAWPFAAMALVAMASGSIIAPVSGLLASMFPTQVRQSGYAVPYNVGVAIFGGPMPLVLVWLTGAHGPAAILYILLPSYLAFLALSYAQKSVKNHFSKS